MSERGEERGGREGGREGRGGRGGGREGGKGYTSSNVPDFSLLWIGVEVICPCVDGYSKRVLFSHTCWPFTLAFCQTPHAPSLAQRDGSMRFGVALLLEVVDLVSIKNHIPLLPCLASAACVGGRGGEGRGGEGREGGREGGCYYFHMTCICVCTYKKSTQTYIFITQLTQFVKKSFDTVRCDL